MSDAATELERMAAEFREQAKKARRQVLDVTNPSISIALSAMADAVDAVADRLTSRAAELRAAEVPSVAPAIWYKILVDLALLSPRQRVELAGKMEVAETTVDRWASGVARPHERVMPLVRSAIDEIVGGDR